MICQRLLQLAADLLLKKMGDSSGRACTQVRKAATRIRHWPVVLCSLWFSLSPLVFSCCCQWRSLIIASLEDNAISFVPGVPLLRCHLAVDLSCCSKGINETVSWIEPLDHNTVPSKDMEVVKW